MDDFKKVLAEEFKDKEARTQYAADFLYSFIALQIKTLRQQRKWSQTQLGRLAGKHQSQISEMERVDFSGWKISTLLKVAEAFDLALTVKFSSFGDFLDDVTSLNREALERSSFADDPAFKQGQPPPVADSELTVRGEAVGARNTGELKPVADLATYRRASSKVSQGAETSTSPEFLEKDSWLNISGA